MVWPDSDCASQRARAGERQRLALRLERPLVSRQQRVSARHGRVQLHDETVRRFFPVADVLAGELDVEIFIRQLDAECRHRRAADDVIHHAAAVGDAFADGKKMEHIRLHRLRQTLDAQGRRPVRLAQAERRLDARELLRKKCRGDFCQCLRAFRRESETAVRRHADKAAHRFCLGHFDARQRPVCFAERLIALQPKLDHLPVGNGLAINDAQFRAVVRPAFRR